MRHPLVVTFFAALSLSLAVLAGLSLRESGAEVTPAGDADVSPGRQSTEIVTRDTDGEPREEAIPPAAERKAVQAGKQLPGQSSTARASTFEEVLNTYAPLARSRLEEFNQRYHDAVSFGSQAELDWLASNGYPLPAEIVEASALPLAELREIAAGGNEKAEFLYFDRLNQQLNRARERHAGSGLDPESVGESREYMEAFVAADTYRRQIADNASPFAGHALARFYEDALQNPYAAIAALYLSGSRGDHAASRAADQLVRRYGIGNEARDALASYTLVLRDRDPDYYQAAPRPGAGQ